MPVVHAHVWTGISEENIKKIISGITDVFVNLGIPRRAVEVIIHEVPKSHWGVDGKPATESLAGVEPPH
jgi:4-oxalocrotonate tautomerase